MNLFYVIFLKHIPTIVARSQPSKYQTHDSDDTQSSPAPRETSWSALPAACTIRRPYRRMVAWATSFCKGRGLRLYGHCGSGFTIRLRPDDFCEPPVADPHDGWCGEGRLNTVPYPIRKIQSFKILYVIDWLPALMISIWKF